MAKTTLFPYQRETVRKFEKFEGRALGALDPGLGKTICTLSYVARNWRQTLPVLIVCPAGVKYTWEDEATKHAGRRVVICESRTPPADSGFGHGAEIYVINYEILPYWVRYFQTIGINTVIIDECQNLINRATKRTKAVKKLAANVEHVIALSATPLMNRPSELWPILNILRPDIWPSFSTFAWEYCEPKMGRWGWEYKGATNLDKLHKELTDNVMVRYRKADVLKDLPSKMRAVIPCELDREGKAEYRKARDDFYMWLMQQDPGKVTSAKRAGAMGKVGYLLRLVARLKLRSVVTWANDFLANTDEKLVLFAYHTKMIEALQRRCKAKSVVISGAVTGRARAAAVEQFSKDPRTRLSINQLQAGGVGLNGFTVAATLGFSELWWRPGDFLQAADRLHRIGQVSTVFENWLVAHGTIEERLCKVLQEKQGSLSAALDGGETQHDIDVFDLLLTELEQEVR